MAPRAAFACVVCASLLAGATTGARGERRPVAVVNLDVASPDLEALRLVDGLTAALEQNPRLQRIPSSHDESALRDYFAPEDAPYLADGQRALARARSYLDEYKIGLSLQSATDGLAQVANASPAAAAPLYADLVFALGVAKLGDGKAADANLDFVLVHRLAPDRKLADDLLPEIVTAYEHAKEPPGIGRLDIDGAGRAWIDGLEVGDAPGAYNVPAGPHLIQVTGADREPRGARVDAVASVTRVVAVADAPLSRELQIDRARLAIVTAPDAMARIVAIRRLAQLIGVRDMVFVDLVRDQGGPPRLTEQTYQDQAGFSAVHAPAEPAQVLDVLAPPPPPPLVEPPPFVAPPPPPPPPIYLRRNYQYGAAAVILGILITSIALAEHEGTVEANTAVHFK